nr:MAG TPA: hypothetical protein [Caudoviricetes sp.]
MWRARDRSDKGRNQDQGAAQELPGLEKAG